MGGPHPNIIFLGRPTMIWISAVQDKGPRPRKGPSPQRWLSTSSKPRERKHGASKEWHVPGAGQPTSDKGSNKEGRSWHVAHVAAGTSFCSTADLYCKVWEHSLKPIYIYIVKHFGCSLFHFVCCWDITLGKAPHPWPPSIWPGSYFPTSWEGWQRNCPEPSPSLCS